MLDTISSSMPNETRETEPWPSTLYTDAANVESVEASSRDATDVASVEVEEIPTIS